MLNTIPRRSGDEERARRYVKEAAAEAGATSESDAAGNTVVRLAPAGGGAGGPVVAVQAHLDMVCEKDRGSDHDFAVDPIRPRRIANSIDAIGTTLGADNGIGVAAALALLTTPGLRHGPLDLLFTVDEERGLRGALALDPALLRARYLINLDSEDPASVFVGSAGTDDTRIVLPLECSSVELERPVARAIAVTGLRGGHSGMEIGEPRGNALKLLAGLLDGLSEAGIDIRIASFDGGTARNAIPREAASVVVLASAALARFDEALRTLLAALDAEWNVDEPGLDVAVAVANTPASVLSPASQQQLVSLLLDLPHGALAEQRGRPGQVKTSANLALAKTHDDHAELTVTTRSTSEDDLRDLRAELARCATRVHASAERLSGYPPWPHERANGTLISMTRELYRSVNGKSPTVEILHGGLECGVIAARVPGLRAVSFGPRIGGAHTTREHVDASTVPPMWELLLALLDRFASDERRQAA